MPTAAFVYADALSQHVLRDDHPMKPHRLRMVYELLDAYGVFQRPEAVVLAPRPATDAELLRVHDAGYVDAVRRLSARETVANAGRYGFSARGDNPVYPGMYEAALLSTGASLVAAEAVASGAAPMAFSISGGLHHAMADRASGFCTFNDPAVAIAWLVAQGLRVAYVDIDVHHGDGVQALFYDTDRVLTVSLHESGHYLFPGTGETWEDGSGEGRGFAVNLPYYPYTADALWLDGFEAVVPPVVQAFAPDVLVAQLGADTHFSDPLAHLQVSTHGYLQAVRRLLELCPRVVALGGGGYNLSSVTRMWVLAYAAMLGLDLPDTIPQGYRDRYGAGFAVLHDPMVPQIPADTHAEAASHLAARLQELQGILQGQ